MANFAGIDGSIGFLKRRIEVRSLEEAEDCLVSTSGMNSATTLLLAILVAAPARSDDVKTYSLTLKDTTFTPAELKVPAGQPFIIAFNNLNAAPAELESSDLQIEKVTPANGQIVVRVKALDKGSYAFVNEFQEDDAKGVIVAE